MTLQEKVLYHQIHPAKLLTDWGTSAISIYYFWQHEIVPALLWMFIPPVIASLIIIRFVDLQPYKDSAFGCYIKQYMTNAMQAVRLAGLIPLIIGGWYHVIWLLPVGVLIILFGWLRGMVGRFRGHEG